MKKAFSIFLFALFFSVSPGALSASTQSFDHSLWDNFLKRFVNEKGEVDYAGIKKDPKLLDQYLEQLKAIDPQDFKEWPREEKIALWLNAYHSGLIKLIVDHYPVANVQMIPGVWQMQSVQIAKAYYSLDDIRNNQLLKTYRDEKIHTVLACAAQSCPKLRREAYTGIQVEGQLFSATRDFVNDPERNTITPGSRKIWLSKIFKWYQTDFILDFGIPENERGLRDSEYAILSFVANYLDDADRSQFLEEGYYKIKYKQFNWRLNDWKKEAEDAASS